jgi:hypothetical protein
VNAWALETFDCITVLIRSENIIVREDIGPPIIK